MLGHTSTRLIAERVYGQTLPHLHDVLAQRIDASVRLALEAERRQGKGS
jgi:hypothetical protein